MNKKLKNSIEIVGLVVTIWGIITAIQNEKIVYIFLLLFVLAALSFVAFREYIFKSIEFHSIDYEFTIHDKEGKRAVCKKKKLFTVYSKNFTTLHDKNIGGTGNVNFIKSNMGKPMQVTEGGSISLITMFHPPLKEDIQHKHTIEMEYINCFTESIESILIQADRKCAAVTTNISFPHDRPCKSAKAYLFFDDSATQLDKPTISDDGKKLEFVVTKPKQFGKYNIEFTW
ncbi:hypothetical protein [Spirosoma agri]|uniref:Uncharacterized protein n=1 Tax=Spirosoma agri TaxID=1987381 RepID=A0A6M0IK82_9BACT|nr:hypothetical protein [Spirosoma agri]NEU67791.1 hypothetical protein [Spirosoma agri]